MAADQAPRRRKSFSFEKLGARIGGLAVNVVGTALKVGSELTVGQMLDLASRPMRGSCLICGSEPQDPPGAMFGANCKARVKAAGMGVVLHAEESVKNLTAADIFEIYKAARDAGLTPEEPEDKQDQG